MFNFSGTPILGGYLSPTDFLKNDQNSPQNLFKLKFILKKYIHIKDMFFSICWHFFLNVIFSLFSFKQIPIYWRKNTHLIPDLYSNILLNDFGFGDFSRLHGHIDGCGKSVKRCTWYAVEVWNWFSYPLVTRVTMTVFMISFSWCQCISEPPSV